jgi:hypothetical protein
MFSKSVIHILFVPNAPIAPWESMSRISAQDPPGMLLARSALINVPLDISFLKHVQEDLQSRCPPTPPLPPTPLDADDHLTKMQNKYRISHALSVRAAQLANTSTIAALVETS